MTDSDMADFDRSLGTLLEDACPVCSEYLDRDEAVTCEDCFQRDGWGKGQFTVHANCAVEADGCFTCFPCVKKTDTGIQVSLVAGRGPDATALRPHGCEALRPVDVPVSRISLNSAGVCVDSDTRLSRELTDDLRPNASRSSDGAAAQRGAIPARQQFSLRDINSHHIAQAIVARSLARDLREGRGL